MEKIQAFVDADVMDAFNALAKRYGWKPGQVVDRLLRFYMHTQKRLKDIEVDQLDEHWGCQPVAVTDDGHAVYEDCLVFSDPYNLEAPEAVGVPTCVVNLVLELKEGLAPFSGFGSLSDEG